jgi:malonyl-CoA O-methyltransferase
MTQSPFHERVREAFGRRVASYEPMARLQRGMAWRLAGLAHHQRGGRPALVLPPGPCADLGAGTGLVGRALAAWRVALPAPLLQVDLCPEALARNSAGPTLEWDLNQGLPPRLRGAALLSSSFALQWLEAPSEALARWGEALAPGGWLLVSVPTAGSFPEWRLAAERAGVPCSALPLPPVDTLLAAVVGAGLDPVRARTHGFAGQPTAAGAGPLEALRALRAIGADASRQSAPLPPGGWRQLLAAWPAGGRLSWEVWVLLARKPLDRSPDGGSSCGW